MLEQWQRILSAFQSMICFCIDFCAPFFPSGPFWFPKVLYFRSSSSPFGAVFSQNSTRKPILMRIRDGFRRVSDLVGNYLAETCRVRRISRRVNLNEFLVKICPFPFSHQDGAILSHALILINGLID